jgi:predicted N-acyltransferase
MGDEQRAEVRVHPRIAELDAEDWDACAGDDDPFVSYAFLKALEDSRSACREEGWLPQHLSVREEDGALLGVVPMYLKTHSYGEYVFDFGWANAYGRMLGKRYYPKLQCCVPFTPVGGPRLLVHPEADAGRARQLLVSAMVEITRHHEVSSLHITFCEEGEAEACDAIGLLHRRGIQYHWQNQGYEAFDDFCGELMSRKRKAVRKERKRAQSLGADVRALRGDDIKAKHWDALHRFYLDTIDRKWASAYLTRDFFELLGEVLADRVVLMVAEHDGRMVAGALNLIGRRALYGRYWGSLPDYRDLHFETCYYRAIELAIEHGLDRVEAGAQGAHKIARGYLPHYTHSAHYIAHPGFRQAIADFLEREQRDLAHDLELLRERSPFRQRPRTDRGAHRPR